MKIGSNSVSKLYVGSTEITKAYIGSNTIWSPTPPSTGISYVGAVPAYGSISSTSSGVLSLSAIPLQPGDLVLVATTNDITTPPAPPGYSVLYQSSANSVGHLLAFKFMGNPVDTQISGLAGTYWNYSAHIAMAFRGVSTSSPIDVQAAATSTTGMPNPPGLSTSVNGAMIVALGYLDDDRISATISPPSGFTIGTTSQSTTTGASMMGAYLLQSTRGFVDPALFTGSGTDAWYAITVALRPA